MSVELLPPSTSAWNVKWPVRLSDGAEVETVLYRGDTLCISSQVGCAVRCPFCASGANGLGRSLAFEELVAQVEAVRAAGHAVSRVTVSGVGEPLHNADAVLQFVTWARERSTPASVTTSGGTRARLLELLASPHNGVTVSVHAGTELTRARVVPHGPSLEALFEGLHEAKASLSQSRRRKLALAFLLVAGSNDEDGEVDAFVERASALGVAVHLYALNSVPTSDALSVERSRYDAVYERMRAAGLVVRMSSRARIDANGGCGTLIALRKQRDATPRGAG